jgi:hypothetical protein
MATMFGDHERQDLSNETNFQHYTPVSVSRRNHHTFSYAFDVAIHAGNVIARFHRSPASLNIDEYMEAVEEN